MEGGNGHLGAHSVAGITREFYAAGQDGGKVENESEKAAVILEYINGLMTKYESRNNAPMPKREINAYGYDLDALKEGRLRPAPLKKSADQNGV